MGDIEKAEEIEAVLRTFPSYVTEVPIPTGLMSVATPVVTTPAVAAPPVEEAPSTEQTVHTTSEAIDSKTSDKKEPTTLEPTNVVQETMKTIAKAGLTPSCADTPIMCV
jgi:hypothetical protein